MRQTPSKPVDAVPSSQAMSAQADPSLNWMPLPWQFQMDLLLKWQETLLSAMEAWGGMLTTEKGLVDATWAPSARMGLPNVMGAWIEWQRQLLRYAQAPLDQASAFVWASHPFGAD